MGTLQRKKVGCVSSGRLWINKNASSVSLMYFYQSVASFTKLQRWFWVISQHMTHKKRSWVQFPPGAGLFSQSILSNVSLYRSLEKGQHYCFSYFKKWMPIWTTWGKTRRWMWATVVEWWLALYFPDCKAFGSLPTAERSRVQYPSPQYLLYCDYNCEAIIAGPVVGVMVSIMSVYRKVVNSNLAVSKFLRSQPI